MDVMVSSAMEIKSVTQLRLSGKRACVTAFIYDYKRTVTADAMRSRFKFARDSVFEQQN